MNIRTIILAVILMLAFVLFGSHQFALTANLYWTTWWADIVTHTLGGMIVGASVIYLLSFRSLIASISCSRVLVATFVVGVLWEYFELYFHLTDYTDIGYYLDTFGDICFDLLGAYMSYLFLNYLSHE